MKYLFGVMYLCLLLVAVPVAASEMTITEHIAPYAVIPMDDALATDEHLWLGILDGFPHLYEISALATTTLNTQLRQLYQGSTEGSLTLIILRQSEDGTGLSEVFRSTPATQEFHVRKDNARGVTFLESELVKTVLVPGSYRVEVSAPNNTGRYVLVTNPSEAGTAGYFELVREAYAIQKTFGFSVVKLLGASYIYYPLGIVLLLFAFYKVRRYQKTFSHVA